MKRFSLLLLLPVLIGWSCKTNQYADLGDGLFADIKTTKGDMVLRLEYEKTPITVANFVSLAEGNSPFVSEEYKEKKYYNGLIFHRVMKDFMIQGGDPLATGRGGPGYKFKDEFAEGLKHSKKGILSMANPGPNANGSQFFITHVETPWLDGRHSVFGQVVRGLEVVDSIANVSVGDGNKPITDVVINEVVIARNGTDAKNFDAVKVMSDYFAEEEARVAEMKRMQEEFASELAQQVDTVEALPSGLKMIQFRAGSEERPKTGQKVLVNYAGWLMDGTLFDTSQAAIAEKFGKYEELNQLHQGDFSPSTMIYSPDSRLIPGFKEALLSLRVGEKVRVFIPSHLGYGPQGTGPIPPNSDLVFDLELVGIAE